MNAEQKPVSSRQFTKEEKKELVEYLCRDCRPIPGGNYPSDLPQEDDEDCWEYLEPNLYAVFISRFVDLLNKEECYYRTPRMAVRRLWEVENGLPKCQMTTLCQYVQLVLETDRLPEKEMAYSRYLSGAREQVETVAKEFNSLRFLLQQEQSFAEQKFNFSSHNDELNLIVDLAMGCLDAALEVRKIRRANFSGLTRRHQLFALRKKACYRMLSRPHKNRGVAELEEIASILQILHEAIDGRVPDVKLYDIENLRDEVGRVGKEYTEKRLEQVEQGIKNIAPEALDPNNESWQDAPRNPKKVSVSIHYSVILALSRFLQDYLQSPTKEDFADNLEDRLRLFVQIGEASKKR